MKQQSIKLSQWAKNNGLSYRGAYDMYKRGQLTGAYAIASGTILVPLCDTKPIDPANKKTAIYARVSTPKQKSDLDTQVDFVKGFCVANGWTVDKIYRETASGLNDDRKQLNKLLEDNEINRVVVANKDRLTRFGFNYLKKLLENKKVELVVVDSAQDDRSDLVQDFVSIITSMAARVYGLRRRKKCAEHILKTFENEQ